MKEKIKDFYEDILGMFLLMGGFFSVYIFHLIILVLLSGVIFGAFYVLSRFLKVLYNLVINYV